MCAVGYQWRSLDVVAAARDGAGRHRRPGCWSAAASAAPSRPAATSARPPAGSWFSDPRQSGGILFELGSHDIDVQRALAGEVESVQATAGAGRLALAGREAAGLHDAVSLALRFRGGGIGAVHVGWTTEGSPSVYTLDVLAADVTLALDAGPGRRLRGRAGGRRSTSPTRSTPGCARSERFFAAVARGDPAAVACTPRDALGTLAVALACETRHRDRPEVQVAPERVEARSMPRACPGSAAAPVASVSTRQNVPVRWSAWISATAVAVT